VKDRGEEEEIERLYERQIVKYKKGDRGRRRERRQL
jgi:hypothetical protein